MPDELDARGERTGGNPATADPPTALSPQEPAGALPLSSFPSRFSASADMSGLSAVEALAAWPQFEVGELLGEGGMGQVFRAVDTVLKRTVALKVLRHQDPRLLGRFLQEAQTQARVDHPNVCKVYEVGEVAGHPYIAMQYVHGQTLDQAAVGLSLEQRVVLMRQVAEAVHAAHQLGLIHRDIKPSNILVEQVEGQGFVPFVTDFGLARETSAPQLTQTGTITGTPQYMSPEQARGSAALLDRRTDVYSLGATLYELLTGRPPFTGGSAVEVLLQVVESDPPRVRQIASEVPEDLETIVLKCMDKEVGRRYESARALAEDLQRFLSGDPILARPASLAYRLAKKARKNKLLTAVTVVSLVAIVTLLSLWGVTRARSAERARLARQFGQESERAAATLRYAYMMPLHDTRPEVRRVEEILRRIDEEAVRAGRTAEGAGNAAVGRALVALGRPREARARLERAWQAGYRDPEVAYALGEALGMVYHQELEQAQRLGNDDLRDARVATLERDLLRPALGFLRQAEGASLAAPAYAQGLIALYEEDFPRAVERAREAERQVPWLFEACLLAGDAMRRQAEVHKYKGEHEQAMADLEACGQEYERASVLARSAPDVYVSQATRWVMVLEVVAAQGWPAEAELEQVLRWADKALEADPDSSGALQAMARAHWRLAEHYQRSGGDPAPPLLESIAASERILKAHPDDSSSHFQLGSALSRLAEVRLSRGQDPDADFARALDHLSRSLELEPGHPITLNNMGLAHWRRGMYRLGLGQDPTPDLERAADAFHRASSDLIAPIVSLNRGNVYVARAFYEQDQGLDPTASLESAVEAYDAALALNPKEAATWSNLGSAQLLLAQQAFETGRDPLPRLRRAEECCREAIELNPRHASALNNLANVHVLAGDLAAAGGEDPLPSYGQASGAMARALAIKPDASGYLRGSAEIELRCAVHALRSGQDAAQFLKRAGPDAERASALNPKNPAVWSTLAEHHLLEARWLESNGQPFAREVTAGLEAVATGLAVNTDDPTTLAHHAFLLALRAAGEEDPAARAGVLREAREAAARARALHPDAKTRLELDECEAKLGPSPGLGVGATGGGEVNGDGE